MRQMQASDFWKNFELGEEVHIAGSFIYNGIRRFHELQVLDHTDELFEFLYNLSVGLERLMKIGVVLYEHAEGSDQNALEKSLITHNHQELMGRLRKHAPLMFSTSQNDLLQLLATFYRTLRYDRFSLKSTYGGKKEAEATLALLCKHLNVDFSNKHAIVGTANTDRYRSFMGRTVLNLSQIIYKLIDHRSSELGLYTYELRSGSKAESVFLRRVNISDEDVLWKELLIFFMNVSPTTEYLKFLKEIDPLAFDPVLIDDYFGCFRSDASKADVMDELESLYDEMEPEDRKERLKLMGVIAAPGVYFDEPEPDDDPLAEEI
jgi:hypothetical protein